MKPIRVYDVMLPDSVMQRLVAGDEVHLSRQNKTYYAIAGESGQPVPVEIRPRLARPVNWRDEKKHRIDKRK